MWDLRPLRNDVVCCFGRDQLALLNPCLRSIFDRREYARYHFSEARRLMEGFLLDKQPIEVLKSLFGGHDDEFRSFDEARSQAAVHTVACVQNMHALSDCFGHAIYFALGMNLDSATAMQPRYVSISSVRFHLPVGEIRNGIEALTCDPGFTYLSALNNHSKHRSIVTVGYSVGMTGEDELPHGLKFEAFSYGEPYPAKWVRPTLSAEYQRQETLLHDIGNRLNETLAMRKDDRT